LWLIRLGRVAKEAKEAKRVTELPPITVYHLTESRKRGLKQMNMVPPGKRGEERGERGGEGRGGERRRRKADPHHPEMR